LVVAVTDEVVSQERVAAGPRAMPLLVEIEEDEERDTAEEDVEPELEQDLFSRTEN
jgi:hypothetical protein